MGDHDVVVTGRQRDEINAIEPQCIGDHANRAIADSLRTPLCAQAVTELEQKGLVFLALAQRELRALANRDVVQDNGQLRATGVTDTDGVGGNPSFERSRVVLDAPRLSGADDVGVKLDPLPFEIGRKLREPFPDDVPEPGVLLVGGVDVRDLDVDCSAVFVEDHLEKTDPLVNRIEDRAIDELRVGVRSFGIVRRGG